MSRLSCTFVAVYASVIIVHCCHCLGFYHHSPMHVFCALVLHWLTGGVGNGGRAIAPVGFKLGSQVHVPFHSCRFLAQKQNNLPSAEIAKYVQFYRLNSSCARSKARRVLSGCIQRPLPSARQHQSYDDSLEVKREYYQNCSVLDCVTQFTDMFTVHSTLT